MGQFFSPSMKAQQPPSLCVSHFHTCTQDATADDEGEFDEEEEGAEAEEAE